MGRLEDGLLVILRSHLGRQPGAGRAGAYETLFAIIGERRIMEPMPVIHWQFSSASLNNASFEEMLDDDLMERRIRHWASRSLVSSSAISTLVRRCWCCRASPGTGKTRLNCAILGAISRRKGESAEVIPQTNARLEKDELFVEFITGAHDAFVVEDADHMLMARSNGNIDLHRFLAVADGVVRAQGGRSSSPPICPTFGTSMRRCCGRDGVSGRRG